MTTITSWAPYFQSAIRAKGRAYQREGRVKLLTPQKGEVARALVKGSQSYTVVVMGHQAGSTVQCTCPVFRSGVYCKHIWATLLELGQSAYGHQAKTAQPGQPAEPAPVPGKTASQPETDDAGAARMPKAKKKDGSAPSQRHSEPAWSSRLTLLRPNDQPDATADSGINLAQKQLCYCVSTEQSAMHGALVICLRQRESTSAGWTRPRRYRISARLTPRLPDPVDRELCAALLGAEPIVYSDLDSSQAVKTPEADTFIIYAGWRSLLKKICDTGRAFLERETGDPIPLTWDQAIPWRLWAAGLEDREGINLKLELRRSENRMSIDDPDLVLGGPDGILISEHTGTPFDDHGATRWVSLFRDDARYGRKRGDFIVPFDDVPRFVERLFSMPNLPEIDLPEEHCPAVEKPEPVPHVEINGASQDTGQLVDAPKGQLVARVEFLYADASVAPSSPGAFIIQKPPQPAAAPGAQAKDLEALETVFDEDSGVQPGVDGDLGAGLDDSGADIGLDPENAGPGLSLVGQKIIRRSPLQEQSHLAFLVNQGFRPHPVYAPDALLLPAKQLHVATEKLLATGWKVSVDKKVLRKASPPRLTVSSGVDWFDIQAMIDFDTGHGIQRVPFPELLAAIKKGSRFITLKDGSQGLLPQQFIDQYHALAGLGTTHEDKIRFASSQAVLLEAMLKDQTDLQTDEGFEQARQRLSQFAGIQPLEPSPRLKGSLRPYQREGLGWLYFLRWLGMGGILADDMGLGKTIQILSLLDRVYHEPRDQHRPTLVIVPRSVVFNWIDEAQHFAPDLRVQAYTGADRKALLEAFDQHDIIVTTYGLVRRDINALQNREFEYVVLDEAQAIKNPSSQSAKAVRLLKARHRLALTGTPIENHLGDIWSIFEFLNPGMLGSQTGFGRLIRGEEGPGAKARPTVSLASPDMADDQAEEVDPTLLPETDGALPGASPQGEAPLEPVDQGTVVNVTRAIRPFVMRRTKQQVLVDLPEKTEQTIYCEMEPEQLRLYDQLRKHYQTALLGEGPGAPTEPGAPAKPAQPAGTMMVLEALLRLRQAACHPGLIDQARAEEKAAKLETLMERLSVLIEQGVKTLVFSQFTSMLALVKQRLDKHGIVYEYLDGQTRDRKARVQRFQTDPACPVFLISLKAGGLGLNLTAAEYVFILDPWWNPAVEAQAIDRAHRIGQNRKVFAYRLICQDTVEQRIAELQQHKRKLADAIVGGEENLLKSLTREDLEKLLS